MSALPPIADINPHMLECLLCTNSGHYEIAIIDVSQSDSGLPAALLNLFGCDGGIDVCPDV